MTKEEFLTWANLQYDVDTVHGITALLELVDTVDEYSIIQQLVDDPNLVTGKDNDNYQR